MRVLVTGWFSFDAAEVTAGDLLARNTVVSWLEEAAVPHDVAVAANFRRSKEISLAGADESAYTHLLFVCGPAAGEPVEDLFARFPSCRRIAVDVSVLEGTHRLGTVELLPRDSDHTSRPDLSLVSPTSARPVVGMVLSHEQPEYGGRQRHGDAHDAIARLLDGMDVARVPLDTRLHPSEADFCSTPDQLESLLSRMDVVVTTRLHGLVLSLKAGIPVLAIDPVSGGGKVCRQAEVLDWPAAIGVERATDDVLRQHLAWCLSEEARNTGERCAGQASKRALQVRSELLRALEH